MLRVWVHGCDPGRVSDASWLALCQTLSYRVPFVYLFSGMCILLFFFLSLCRFRLFVFFFCSHWSFVDVPLIFFCPADHVPDWQPRILLGMVEARSVNVKKTTTTTAIFRFYRLHLSRYRQKRKTAYRRKITAVWHYRRKITAILWFYRLRQIRYRSKTENRLPP